MCSDRCCVNGFLPSEKNILETFLKLSKSERGITLSIKSKPDDINKAAKACDYIVIHGTSGLQEGIKIITF